MLNLEIFLVGLMIVSTVTGLVTEGVKKTLDACKVNYNSNILAGIVAAVLSAAIGVGYVLINGIGFSAAIIVYIVAMTFLGWLGAMVGYDKVIGMIKNFKKGGNE